MVLAAMLPLGAAREIASRFVVPASLATAGVLVGPAPRSLKTAHMIPADTLCKEYIMKLS